MIKSTRVKTAGISQCFSTFVLVLGQVFALASWPWVHYDFAHFPCVLLYDQANTALDYYVYVEHVGE